MSLAAIEKGLDAGHDFLRLLQACAAKSSDALDRLSVILQSTVAQAEDTAAVRARNASFWQPPSPTKLKRIEHLRRAARKDLQQSTPGGPAVFQRPKPLSEITWPRRKVPLYLISCGLPILKYPGPQSILMNRVIKQKWRRDIKQLDKLESLEAGLHLAETEDSWDALMKEHGIDENPQPPKRTQREFDQPSPAASAARVSWQETFSMATREVRMTSKARQSQNRAMGEKLFKVLKEERELREKERRAAKHERRMARKRAQGYVNLSAGIDEGGAPVVDEATMTRILDIKGP